jgi:glycosyltransferase involved in cell wall biosynthesis
MISIVFITCDRMEELSRAIVSCIDKIDEDFEVIVIDNNSSDDTAGRCRGLAEEHGFSLNYHFNEVNKGVSASRNMGFAFAKGDIVYFLDDDAVVQGPDKCITAVAAFMRAHPEYPVSATEIYNVTYKYYQRGPFPAKAKDRSEGDVFHFVGASHFINKRVFPSLTLYPDEFVYGGDEYYLSFFLHSLGLRIYYYKGMLVNHIPSNSNRLTRDETLINSYCNMFNVKRYFSPRVFIPVIWGMMVIRMFLRYYGKPALFKTFFHKIGMTYNDKYCSPMKSSAYLQLISLFGFRIIL